MTATTARRETRGRNSWGRLLGRAVVVVAVSLGLTLAGANAAQAVCPGSLCSSQGAAVLATGSGGGALTGGSAAAGAATVSLSKGAQAGSGFALLAGLGIEEATLNLLGLDPVKLAFGGDVPGWFPSWWPRSGGDVVPAGCGLTRYYGSWVQNGACVEMNSAAKDGTFRHGTMNFTGTHGMPNNSRDVRVFQGTKQCGLMNWSIGSDYVFWQVSGTQAASPAGAPNCTAVTRVDVEVYDPSKNTQANTLWLRIAVPGVVPGAPAPGPETVTFRSDVVCTFGTGGTQKVASWSAPVSNPYGALVEMGAGYCPSGSVATAHTVTARGASGSETVVASTSAPSWVQSLPASQPACLDGSCRLVLFKGTVPCISETGWNATCTGWAADPSRADRYSCKFGPYSQPLDRCAAYADMPGGDLRPTGNDAGEPVPALGSPEDEADKDNSEGPAAGLGCSPGWNPLTWLTSVVCLVESLLVPSPETMARFADLGDLAQSRGPFPVIESASEWLAPPAGGTTCLVLDLPLPGLLGGEVLPVLDSCQDGGFVGWLRDNRALTGVLMWLLFALPLAQWAFAAYAPGAQGSA